MYWSDDTYEEYDQPYQFGRRDSWPEYVLEVFWDENEDVFYLNDEGNERWMFNAGDEDDFLVIVNKIDAYFDALKSQAAGFLAHYFKDVE